MKILVHGACWSKGHIVQELIQIPLFLLSALLLVTYLFARQWTKMRLLNAESARRRHLSRVAKKLRLRDDVRPVRERVMDHHLRDGIFTVTEAAQIEGYAHSELGDVRVEGGVNHEMRLKRAAAQRYPHANAVIKVQEERDSFRYLAGTGPDGQPLFKTRSRHEWCGIAVLASPLVADMIPPASYRDDLVLIDGSNLMDWDIDAGRAKTASLRPINQVIAALKAKGVAAGVVFDADAGQRLEGRFLSHDALAARLPDAIDVLVVDQDRSADEVLVEMAHSEGLVIVSNDPFRDAPTARHLLKQKGFIEGDEVHLLTPRA